MEKDLPSKGGEALFKTCRLEPGQFQVEPARLPAESAPQWFAAYTLPRHEKYVSETLFERRVETFLPLYRSPRQWKKSRPVVLDLPLFPTYVFIRIARRERSLVLRMPGVISIVGSSKDPWALPDREIEALRLGMEALKFEPHPYLRTGEKVRVRSGVLRGVEGVLTRTENECHLILAFDAIMRSVSVEVDADDLEPVVPIAEKREVAS